MRNRVARRIAWMLAPGVPRCGEPAASAPEMEGARIEEVAVPGLPFDVAPTPDGRHAFVSMPARDGASALAVLSADPWRLVRTFELPAGAMPRGLALSKAGERLLVASGAEILVLDAAALLAGQPLPILSVAQLSAKLATQVALTPDERAALATGEDNARLAILHFGDTLHSDVPQVQRSVEVPVGDGPVGVIAAGAPARAYVTSQANRRGLQPGQLTVVDVEAALADPDRAILTSAAAGCQPVRVTRSPGPAGTLWVTARGANSVVALDPAGLESGQTRPKAVVRVGSAPVGICPARQGALIVVCNSDRYGAGGPSSLTVIDAQRALAGRPALVGTVRAGVFAREIAVLADGETLLSTNFRSRTVQITALPSVPAHPASS